MDQRSTLEYIADLMIRSAIAEAENGVPLNKALEVAYPFRDLPQGDAVWREALIRHGLENAAKDPQTKGRID